jgi:RNA polymerase sigma factor (sigma-70 family)
MDTLDSIVRKAQDGDVGAFAILVHRFQDMAVGYGYSMLRDFHLAEDAAQEAFFEAYRHLGQLREPAAFAVWLRRIVFKQCDRTTRRRAVETVPLESAHDPAAPTADPPMTHEIFDAIHALPDHERDTMLLFYISGYSMDEVGAFLDVPVSTVKGRLHSARNRLRASLLDTIGDSLRSRRPSRDESFASAVVELLAAARIGDAARVGELLRAHPRLLVARDPMGNTALILAVNGGHRALADILFEAGVEPGFHEAAAIGDTTRMQANLEVNPGQLDSCSPEGFPALALAAHFGQLASLQFLLDRGADIDRVARHPLKVTPLQAALFGRQTDAALALITRGADVNLARGGDGPRSGWTALHYAAGLGMTALIQPLLDRGADPSLRDVEGRTPLDVATAASRHALATTLGERGTR